MSSSEVRAVTSGGGVVAGNVEVEKNSSAKINEVKEVNPENDGVEVAQAKTITLDEAKKVAAEIQSSLENAKDLKVSFDVDLSEAGDNTIKFKVVDSSTGEIVREYPPQVAKSLKALEGKGLLIAEKA
ncbi:MAG: flagellar protein FlaG [Proteobacteria bacterium]|nr:flagellar protein FlaG [Pseudomonadota bacterium]